MFHKFAAHLHRRTTINHKLALGKLQSYGRVTNSRHAARRFDSHYLGFALHGGICGEVSAYAVSILGTFSELPHALITQLIERGIIDHTAEKYATLTLQRGRSRGRHRVWHAILQSGWRLKA
jgi:hypothetical protein